MNPEMEIYKVLNTTTLDGEVSDNFIDMTINDQW